MDPVGPFWSSFPANHSPSSNQNTNIIVVYKEMPVVTGLGLPLMKGLSHILGGARWKQGTES